jgi:hypothetical protein
MIESVVGGHTALLMTKRYWQAVGFLDTVEAHKRCSPVVVSKSE